MVPEGGCRLKTRTFRVVPKIPEKLKALETLAYNTWWTWTSPATELFKWMDSDLWEQTTHNPVRLLGCVSQKRLYELADDKAFISRLGEVSRKLDGYLSGESWFDREYRKGNTDRDDFSVATFSAEFGLHESLPIYSGGLGVLAGDTMKSVSDLGLPMVGVSLLYREGYFSQYLNSDGWQQERYFVNDYSNMPVTPVIDAGGEPVKIEVPLAERSVTAAIWRIRVGRTELYLLDTCLPENSMADREITGQLYGGDKDMRIRQEILLGIGGIRALRTMGRTPAVRHINEGHSGFLVLELIRQFMSEQELTFEEARELVIAGNVFTTHTPVPAGNEEFHPDLVLRYLSPMLKEMNIEPCEFLSYGRHNSNDNFSMTVFAMNFSRYRNGVSRLHGEVSRKIWSDIWPGLPQEDVPIEHVTNGVHFGSWLSDEMAALFERHLGPEWPGTPFRGDPWKKVESIPSSELWRGHERLRERLVTYARKRWENQLHRMGLRKPGIEEIPVLNPEVLTIGFARRFAAYKRAALLLSDEKRLLQILDHPEQPVQIIFAGKAHPRDHGGKELIRKIFHICMKDEFYGKVIYLEDYSIEMARQMVQGVDVWLNTPRIPMEASGTSGMKACINGAVHCSVLDGWWAEAYRVESGWSIGCGESYSDPSFQDQVETKALFDIIENQIAPLFYHRGQDGVPARWIEVMKRSISETGATYSSDRMLAEYLDRFYMPSYEYVQSLSANDFLGARELASWKSGIREHWDAIEITEVSADIPPGGFCSVGQIIPITVKIDAQGFEPEDLAVEIHFGTAGSDEWITDRLSIMLEHSERNEQSFVFKGSIECLTSGNRGFTVRILPKHRLCGRIVEPGLVHWWE